MTDCHPVYRLSQEAYDQLRLAADENPDLYLDSETDFDQVLRERGVSDPFEETSITTDRPIALTPVAEGEIPNRADRQALHFYRSFDGMSPNRATDERLWGLDDPLPSSCLRPQALAASVQPQHAELRSRSLVQFWVH